MHRLSKACSLLQPSRGAAVGAGPKRSCNQWQSYKLSETTAAHLGVQHLRHLLGGLKVEQVPEATLQADRLAHACKVGLGGAGLHEVCQQHVFDAREPECV